MESTFHRSIISAIVHVPGGARTHPMHMGTLGETTPSIENGTPFPVIATALSNGWIITSWSVFPYERETMYTSEEMMAIAAARRFRDGATCFVGVGLPSTAACLARVCRRRCHLVYESGAIGSKPRVTPLSVADPEWPTPPSLSRDRGSIRILAASEAASILDFSGRLRSIVSAISIRP